jgi:replicative DNA helicase Mcm
MNPEDRSSMHEALEQQTISVAKAGIVATFKANTAVLAAANPKFSRFDSYKPLAEQFDIPPTLLSRFDLIFPIRDLLDKEVDRAVADHILKIHGSGKDLKDLEPDIPTDLLRKYVAYARKNINPILSEDAAEKIKEYYLQLRSGSKDTVRATPRQLEALVRLSEASAKVRLSKEVTVTDAERAITLTEFVLREVAYDQATGQIDIDRIVSDHPKSTRDRIKIIEEIVAGLIKESSEGFASHDEIIEVAKGRGLDRFRAEEILMELKTKGVIYEPRHNRYMLTEG